MTNLPAHLNGKKGKAKPGPRYPRPKTGMEEAEKIRRVQRFNDLDADMQEAGRRWREQQAGAAS